MTATHELELERTYIAGIYSAIEQQRQAAREVLAEVLYEHHTGYQALFERDRMAESIDDRLARLNPNMPGVCFGKLVEADSHLARYIGRIALSDDEGDPMLIDWRAPAAAPFYRATAVDPMGMMLRRHLIMAGRDLVGLEDDLLSIDAVGDAERPTLVGEAALMAALAKERTGHMADIVATIQRDQDEIIRTPLKSTLLVTGGPGTGKTVVALHRAAYLLYTYRDRIANNGVLFVGPSNLFMRYVERVLPALGESSVMMIDWADLLPDITGVAEADPIVADVKGSLAMVDVLRRAVRFFERAPAAGVRVTGLDGEPMRVSGDVLAACRRQARAGGVSHHQARRRFEQLLTHAIGLGPSTETDFRDVCLASIRAAVDRLWPELRPDDLLETLLTTEQVLEFATRDHVDPDTARRLLRGPQSAWTTSDLPLLDELRVMLGDLPRQHDRVPRGQHPTDLRAAQEIIDDLSASMAATGGGGADVPVAAIVTPEMLIARHEAGQRQQSIAEQARRDPTWKFAHIVVDEAQDVSPMQWRALARRCQAKSMTIVGDPDQMSRPTDESWVDRITTALEIDACDERTLHINYRTPADIVRPAQQLRAMHTPTVPATTTTYARTGDTPWAVRCRAVDVDAIRAAVDRARAQLGDRGRVAVISATRDASIVERALSAGGDQAPPHGAARLTHSVAAYLASEVKGLEFDAVIVVDPAAIQDECGWRQLYVVLTRSTTQLGLLLTGDLADFERHWLDTSAVTLPTP